MLPGVSKYDRYSILLKGSFRDDRIALNFCFPGIVDRQEIWGRIKDIQTQDRKVDMGIEFESIAWWVPPYD